MIKWGQSTRPYKWRRENENNYFRKNICNYNWDWNNKFLGLPNNLRYES